MASPVGIWREGEEREGMESAEKTMLMEERVIEMIAFAGKIDILSPRK